MARQTREELYTEVQNKIYENLYGDITGQDLRDVLLTICESFYNLKNEQKTYVRVEADGSISVREGAGFTCVRTGVGRYTITYNGDRGYVNLVQRTFDRTPILFNTTGSSIIIEVYDTLTGVLADGRFEIEVTDYNDI